MLDGWADYAPGSAIFPSILEGRWRIICRSDLPAGRPQQGVEISKQKAGRSENDEKSHSIHFCNVAFGNKRERSVFADNAATRIFSIWGGPDHARDERIPSED